MHLSIWTLPECTFWTQGIIDGITPLLGRDNRRYQSIQRLICQRKISTRMITTKNIPFVDDIPILNSECLLPFVEGYQPSNIHNWVETVKNDLTMTSGRKKTQLSVVYPGCIQKTCWFPDQLMIHPCEFGVPPFSNIPISSSEVIWCKSPQNDPILKLGLEGYLISEGNYNEVVMVGGAGVETHYHWDSWRKKIWIRVSWTCPQSKGAIRLTIVPNKFK